MSLLRIREHHLICNSSKKSKKPSNKSNQGGGSPSQENFTTLEDWKPGDGRESKLMNGQNPYCENGYTSESDTHIQYNSHQNSKTLFSELEKTILKYIWKHKDPN